MITKLHMNKSRGRNGTESPLTIDMDAGIERKLLEINDDTYRWNWATSSYTDKKSKVRIIYGNP